jgi:hypothetical protein
MTRVLKLRCFTHGRDGPIDGMQLRTSGSRRWETRRWPKAQATAPILDVIVALHRRHRLSVIRGGCWGHASAVGNTEAGSAASAAAARWSSCRCPRYCVRRCHLRGHPPCLAGRPVGLTRAVGAARRARGQRQGGSCAQARRPHRPDRGVAMRAAKRCVGVWCGRSARAAAIATPALERQARPLHHPSFGRGPHVVPHAEVRTVRPAR